MSHMYYFLLFTLFFFFNDTATTEIYTLSLHDALPILSEANASGSAVASTSPARKSGRSVSAYPNMNASTTASATVAQFGQPAADRKSTRLNSSHANISYAVFCLKKKNKANEFTGIDRR